MDKTIIVANLKSFKDISEGKNWLDEFLKNKQELESLNNKEIIIAPSFTLLSSFYSALFDTNIKLAAQNISPFEEGAYTGEINAKQLKDFVSHIIIGHSERRNYFNESEDLLENKVKMALSYELEPIFCVQDKSTKVYDGTRILAYEPIFAIGSGNPDTPENAQQVCESFVDKNSECVMLYGGSVNSQNVTSFTKGGKIKGVLVGSASLDPQEFFKIIYNA